MGVPEAAKPCGGCDPHQVMDMTTVETFLAWLDRDLVSDQGDDEIAALKQLINQRRADLAQMGSLDQVRSLVQAHAVDSNLPKLFDVFEAALARWERTASAGIGYDHLSPDLSKLDSAAKGGHMHGPKAWVRTSKAWLTADPDDEHRQDLLQQFYSTLHVIYLAARQSADSESSSTRIDTKIRQLFGAAPSWGRAYEIEQLLSLIMTEEQVDAELNRRLEEAKAVKLPYVVTLGEQWSAASEGKNSKSKRAIFQRLLNDLQWFHSQDIKRRAASKKLAVRVSSMFLSAFLFFFLVLSIQFLAQPKISTTNLTANNNTADTAPMRTAERVAYGEKQ
jgi:hypothetical protein